MWSALKRYYGPAVILLLYAAGALFILPRFNFSFNDDWVYLRMGRLVYEHGYLRYLGYEQAMALAQAFAVGLAWRLAGGVSFLVSGAFTLTLSLLGCLAFYAYLRKLELDRGMSLAGTLLLAFNPIWFLNSFDFMTDVPSLAMALVSLYLFQLSRGRAGTSVLALASLVSVLGFLNRQFNFLIPAAFFTAALVQPQQRRALDARRVFLMIVLPSAVAVAGTGWWLLGGRMVTLSGTPHLLDRLKWGYILLYAGLFTFPLWMASMLHPPFWRIEGRRVLPLMLALAGLTALTLTLFGRGFPFLPNQISPYGVFDHNAVLRGVRRPVFSPWFLALLTILSVVGFTFLGATAAARFPTGKKESFRRFLESSPVLPLYLFTIYYAAAQFLTRVNFDRYLIYLIPGFTVFLLEGVRKTGWNRRAVVLCLGLLLGFSLIHTGGAVSWNRAVWREAEKLVARGVRPTEIDAGYAWCGWHHVEERRSTRKERSPELRRRGKGRGAPWYLSSFFPRQRDDYVISFSPPDEPGWTVTGQAPWRALPFESERFVYVWRRRNDAP